MNKLPFLGVVNSLLRSSFAYIDQKFIFLTYRCHSKVDWSKIDCPFMGCIFLWNVQYFLLVLLPYQIDGYQVRNAITSESIGNSVNVIILQYN